MSNKTHLTLVPKTDWDEYDQHIIDQRMSGQDTPSCGCDGAYDNGCLNCWEDTMFKKKTGLTLP